MASIASSKTRIAVLSDRRAAGFAALLLGAFFVYGAGLANSAVLHDTAHDTRHSYGFPCH